jgi:geranylgeranyl diphosphate synthase type II
VNQQLLMLDQISKALDEELAKQAFGQTPASLYEPIRYIMKLGGKRIRPLLACLSYGIYNNNKNLERVLPAAAAVEVFHNFTLMHDDIMDNAPLRRGKQTVHEKWNVSTGILSGDVMLVKTYEMLIAGVAEENVNEVLRLFNSTAIEVCEGQQLDMEFESARKVTEEQYIEMIRLKTASLIGFSIEMGALLAGASKTDRIALHDFGVNMGIGFQLMDDFLDVYGVGSKFGKQVGGDIVSNKKTFLLIKALEASRGKTRSELAAWVASKRSSKRKITAVTDIYNKLGIPEMTRARIQSYFDKALDGLSGVNGDTGALLSFARSMMDRQH